MLNLEKIAEDFAKEKNIQLNSFDLGGIRDIQRMYSKNKEMSPADIVDELGKQKKFSLELEDRRSRKQLEEMIKQAK